MAALIVCAPGGGNRAFCDRMNSWAQGEGQPGLGYIFWREGEEDGAGPIARNIGPERTAKLRQFLAGPGAGGAALASGLPDEIVRNFTTLRPNGLQTGDAVFFVGGNPDRQYRFAGEARTRVATELGLVPADRYEFCWIVDFPMYEWNEEEKKIDFSHNPFSMPQGELAALEGAKSREELLAIKAYQYDIVCNGYEIASGGIRNHKPATMVKAFGIAGLGPEVVEQRFGGMYRAFQYGAPPHGGMAAGIDRMVMLLVGARNLREVALFPMNQQANDLLMGAPSDVAPKQLRELHIRLAPPER